LRRIEPRNGGVGNSEHFFYAGHDFLLFQTNCSPGLPPA
jgi:hypothetical protein